MLSSQIEGTQSSLSDLLLFEKSEKISVPLDDVKEVSNYIKAVIHDDVIVCVCFLKCRGSPLWLPCYRVIVKIAPGKLFMSSCIVVISRKEETASQKLFKYPLHFNIPTNNGDSWDGYFSLPKQEGYVEAERKSRIERTMYP